MTPEEFIDSVASAAVQSMQATRIPASFVIAEGALESGWGSSDLYLRGKNIFGVKVYPGWDGDILQLPTKEYIDGQFVTVSAKWCLYPDYLSCIADHAKFLQGPRYEHCFAFKTGTDFAIAVQHAGYATDPNYAEKITSIIRQHNLGMYDNVNT